LATAVFTTASPSVSLGSANVDLSELLEPEGQFVGWRADVAVFV